MILYDIHVFVIDVKRTLCLIIQIRHLFPFFIENEVHNGVRTAHADIRQVFHCILQISALFIVESLEFFPHIPEVIACVLKCVSLLEIVVHHMVDNKNRKCNCKESPGESPGDRCPFLVKNGYSLPGLPRHLIDEKRAGKDTQTSEKDHRKCTVPDHVIGPVHIFSVRQKDRIHVKVFHYSTQKEGLPGRRSHPLVKKDSHKRSEDTCKYSSQTACNSRKARYSQIHACIKPLRSGKHSCYDSRIGVKKETRR